MRKTVEVAAKRRLGDIIVERGLITAEQLEHALLVQRESGSKLGEVRSSSDSSPGSASPV